MDVKLPLDPTDDASWLLVEEGCNLVREHEIESIFAVANGYVGVRASLEEGSPLSQPGTFVSGVYVDDATELGPALAVLPDWAHLEISVEGERLSMRSGRVLEHRRALDLRQGILWREWRQQSPGGRITRVRFLRLASLADTRVLLQSVTVTAENYVGRIEVLADTPGGPAGHQSWKIARRSTGIHPHETTVALASGSVCQPHCEAPSSHLNRAGGGEQARWCWEAVAGRTVRLDRVVVLYTSRDVTDPVEAARNHVAAVQKQGVPALARAHVDAWKRRWDTAEVMIVGDEEAQRALRFAVYHLVANANPGDEYASIGARGLTGEAYRGHVFWDTEIYLLPFYIFTNPAVARALLMYRYHTLDAARQKAKARGYRGALYAWESADTGEETTPPMALAPDGRVIPILTGEQEHHISADIAYAVWQYWRATGDDDFMATAGSDILVETARFWASRARIDAGGHAHVGGVIGPDEYHETVDDNAYTNVMARWNLRRAADVVAFLKHVRPSDWAQLSKRLALVENEPDSWHATADALVTGFQRETLLIEQFEGYFALEDVAVGEGSDSPKPINGSDQARRSQVLKQADVVALSALLWDEWSRAVHEANFRYYEPRTAHGSSLSPALHALVAAKLGDVDLAQNYLRQAGEIDLANNMGNASGGVHMAALGGLWQAVVFGLAGLRAREDGIALEPHLPKGWTQLRCCVRWRGRALKMTLTSEPARIEIALDQSSELTVGVVDGPACLALPGRRYATVRKSSEWGEWQEVNDDIRHDGAGAL